MDQVLRLNSEERKSNSIYDTQDGKRGVLSRVYGYEVTLNNNNLAQTIPHRPALRSRMYKLSFSGDIAAFRVSIKRSDGEQVTVGSCHVPLLCGCCPTSTRSVITGYLGAYPVSPAQDYALQPSQIWTAIFDPNIIIPADQQLVFDWSLENQQDPNVIAGNSVFCAYAVHEYEFPNYRGNSGR